MIDKLDFVEEVTKKVFLWKGQFISVEYSTCKDKYPDKDNYTVEIMGDTIGESIRYTNRCVIPDASNGIGYFLQVGTFGISPTLVLTSTDPCGLKLSAKFDNRTADDRGILTLILPKGMDVYSVHYQSRGNSQAYHSRIEVFNEDPARDFKSRKMENSCFTMVKKDEGVLDGENGKYMRYKVDRTRVYNPETGEIEPTNASTMGGE